VWHDPLSGIEMVWVPAGSFVMGSGSDDPGRQHNDGDESPAHRVTISRGFWLGRCEVTQAQWEAVTGQPAAAHFPGADRPVERVSWDDVQTFIVRLNERAGEPLYRLPTEAEWEYACRAGCEAPYHFGDDVRDVRRYAWFNGNAEGRTHPVGCLKPNRWGFFDMAGNVLEWCADRYAAGYYGRSPVADPPGADHGTSRVLRGASWYSAGHDCRSADRRRGRQWIRAASIGFRLARVAD
jgi:formylglycine-generating enzyme required for sulfatase activity